MNRFLVAALAAAFCVPVHAQTDEAVVVNATRFPEDARRLPASVTVITAEDIRKSPARTLPELLTEQVGITQQDLYGNNAAVTSIDLRGFGITGGQNTLVLLDGRRMNDIDLTSVQWAALPLAGIERIEILRGSGAVLYGDGASAGVINIVTRSPLRDGNSVEAFGRVATFATSEGQLYGSHGAGNFGINASVYTFNSDGYRQNNRNEQTNYTGNLRWALGATTLDARFGADHQDLGLPGARRIQPSIGLDEYATDRRGAQTPNDFASRDGARAGATLSHLLGEVELSVGLDWRDKQQRSFFEQQFVARGDSMSVLSLTPRARVPFQLGAMAHRLTLGADWHSWSYDSRRDSDINNLGRPVNRVRATQRNAAFYAQDLIELSRATRVSLGLRTEQVRYDATDTLDAGAPGFLGFQASAGSAREKQRETAWDLGVRHALGAQLTGFARAGRTFRFVNIDELYDFDALGNPQFQILRPQHAITIETGAEWRSGRHFLKAGVFRTDVTNEIHLDPFTAGVGNTNLPPSRRQGVELEGALQAAEALRLRAGYTYTDARFREGTLPGGPFAIGTNLDIAGKHVPLVPTHKLNAGFAWNPTPRSQLTGSLLATSSQYLDNDEPNTLGVKIPRALIADLKYAYRFAWGRVALSVNNLFNRSYYTYAVRSQFTADRYAVYPLPGRTVGLTVEFKLL
ncbi:MAG TPA: TonB-dependent receptor [Burkholderiales bacterium]|nr:TonB-dependent receptor [Burkholderiales bacterium]